MAIHFPRSLPNPLRPLAALLPRRAARRAASRGAARAVWAASLLPLLAACSVERWRARLEAALWHSKRAYGCSKA